MKYRVDRETERIDIGDGLWIEAKKEMTHGELVRIRSAMIDYDLDGEPHMKPDTEGTKAIYITVALVDWNLQDENGAKLPIIVEAIQDLNDDFVAMLMETLKKFYLRDAKDDEAKNVP